MSLIGEYLSYLSLPFPSCFVFWLEGECTLYYYIIAENQRTYVL
jgi:hypothetical protein